MADRGGKKFRIERDNLSDNPNERPAPRALARHSDLKARRPRLKSMKNSTSCLFVIGVLPWGMLASGCSAGTAALGPVDCRPGDSTMTCCIKKYPYDPAEACGAVASDIEAAIKAGARVENALERRADDGAGEGGARRQTTLTKDGKSTAETPTSSAGVR
jgi:hypothetical protein